MKTKVFILALITAAIAGNFISCNKEPNAASSPQATVLDLPTTAYDYSIPTLNFSSGNAKATLGRVLFYDQHLSVNNAIACASCHKQGIAFSDNASSSVGYQNAITRRNTPPIQNLQTANTNDISLFWDGRAHFPDMVTKPVLSHIEMGMSDVNAIVQKVSSMPYYKELFVAAYGNYSDVISIDNINEALTAFVQSIFSGTTRFDQFQAGTLTLTGLEEQGRQLFFNKYNCNSCHQTTEITLGSGGGYGGGGSNGGFKDRGFVNIGLDAEYTDNGLGELSKKSSDNGKFKIPNLRNVVLTAPYMHDGRFKTLDEVFDHYSHNIQNHPNLDPKLLDSNSNPIQMNISPEERSAIIAFLGTMTDYQMISDPKFSNPFKVKL